MTNWTVVGVGKSRTWTLATADGEALAKIYAGKRYVSYLVHDDQEALFNNTAATRGEHKRLILEALQARFKKLEQLFGAPSPRGRSRVGRESGHPHMTRAELDALMAEYRTLRLCDVCLPKRTRMRAIEWEIWAAMDSMPCDATIPPAPLLMRDLDCDP